jgi:hypothetical protein
VKSKRWISVLLFTLVLSLVCCRQVVGAIESLGEQKELLTYKVRIKKFEVSYDWGTSYTTVFEGLSPYLDLTTSNGTAAGDFFTDQSVPVGTINWIRVTVDKTMQIKGKVDYNPAEDPTQGYYFTTATGASEETRDHGGDGVPDGPPPAGDGAVYALQEIDIPTGDYVHEQIIAGVVVRAGETVTLRMSFQLLSAITCMGCGGCPWGYFVIPQTIVAVVTPALL